MMNLWIAPFSQKRKDVKFLRTKNISQVQMGIPQYTRPSPLTPARLERFQKLHRCIPMIHYSSHDDDWAQVTLRHREKALYSILQRSWEYLSTHIISPLHHHSFAARRDSTTYEFEICEQEAAAIEDDSDFDEDDCCPTHCNYGCYQSE